MRRIAAIACAVSVGLISSVGMAQSTIRRPGEHPVYVLEAEPHLAFGLFAPPGEPSGSGFGGGMRFSIPILRNGFVRTINNSVAVSVGVDWLYYDASDLVVGACSNRVNGPGPTDVCTKVAGPVGGPSHYLYLPGALQWNFWLSQKFSAFGEPGLGLYFEKGRFQERSHLGLVPELQVGGRWHFVRRGTLTLRLGYPVCSLGVSVLF